MLGKELKKDYKIFQKNRYRPLSEEEIEQLVFEVISAVDPLIIEAKSDPLIIEKGFVQYDITDYINRTENKRSQRKLVNRIYKYYKGQGFLVDRGLLMVSNSKYSSLLKLDFRTLSQIDVICIILWVALLLLLTILIFHLMR